MISDRLAAVKINDIHRVEQNNEEILVFDPFNPVNKEIEESDVRALLSRFGIPASVPIDNMALYRRAFVHKSYVRKPELENKERGVVIAPKPDDCMALKSKSNDRLEFVGDGVLECITKYYLYERFPKNDEGFMTDTKIALVKNDAIGQLALDIGLHKWYILSKNAELKNTRNNIKKLGNLFEAFLGAMFLDFNKVSVDDPLFKTGFLGPGFQLCQKWLVHLFETPGLVPWHRIIETNENYKNQLQVLIQKEFKTVPLYLEQGGTNNTVLSEGITTFHMGVYLCLGVPTHVAETTWQKARPIESFSSWKQVHEDTAQQGGRILVLLGQGSNKIKKRAEQAACQIALEKCVSFV